MMKKMVFPVILMILTGLVFTAFFSCNTGDKEPGTTTYSGKDTDGRKYELLVTGGKYELKIDGVSISTGKVSINGSTLTLSPNADGEAFEVVVDGRDISKIEGSIPPDNGDDTPITPGEMVPPFTGTAGEWIWFTSDDSKVSGTTYEPGGVSRITNAKPITDPDGNPAQEPYEYPENEKPKDKDGKEIPGKVYNFTGNTKVDPAKPSGTAGAKYGAGWPMVGWEAQPADDETLELLKTAYGYSFWVRLNSSKTNNTTNDKWSYLTQVVTDFEPEQGYEYKHWFGNGNKKSGEDVMGDSGGGGANNFTGGLQAGTWHKITVIMNKSGCNMQQDKWLFQYPPTPDPKGPFNQNAAQKIQWQIPLQHNGGQQRSGDPYDQISGTHDFNLDLYGLELLTKQ